MGEGLLKRSVEGGVVHRGAVLAQYGQIRPGPAKSWPDLAKSWPLPEFSKRSKHTLPFRIYPNMGGQIPSKPPEANPNQS